MDKTSKKQDYRILWDTAMNKQNSYWWLICQMILFCGLQCTLGFYVPGIAPVEFKKGDPVDVKAVKMTSPRTQLPYEYYSLPFCKPPGEITYKSLNLGEILRGDRIVNTPYNVRMLENVSCRFLCTSSISAAEAKEVINRIQESYSIHLLVDNLPSATKLHLLDSKTAQYTHGFPLGFSKENKFYIYNHLQFVIKYNSDDQDTFRVVGFEVEPLSLNPQFVEITNENAKECQLKSFTNAPQPMELKEEDMKIAFSYDIQWVSSPIRWASRWDSYLTMTDSDIHWFSIINSVVVIFFLSGILAMIMIRTLRKDIARYNRDDDEEESLEESGWKLVHGDVFRPPQYPLLLSATIGSGIQLFLMMLFTIFFAMLGMLSPASRGALMSAGIFTYVFMGMFAGFFSARIYKTVRGQQWKTAALWTAMLVPGIVMGIGFLLNFFIWGKRSSAAIPFTTMLALLCMWLGISLPLVFTGAYFGYRKNPYQQPVRTNQIPRAVPPQKWYHGLGFSVIVAGVLPFGALFIELFFIFTAIWERQFYYMFGFLFIVFIIMVISVSQISVVLVYFQLCSENYHWWWRSFITSGGSALYIFGYSIFYFYTKLEITDFVPTLLYFGYSFIMAFILFILTGTVGFYAAYSFVNKIYAAIKID